MAQLEAALQAHMWGVSKWSPTPHQLLQSALAWVAGTVMCGCDFVALKGSNFPHTMEALPSFVKTEHAALARLAATLQDTDEKALVAAAGVRTLCCAISAHMAEVPRYGRQSALLREAEDDILRKVVWTLSYWCGRERVADARWGFSVVGAASAAAESAAAES